MKLIKLSLFDVRNGFRQEWIKFLLSFFICIACCSLMYYQLSLYMRTNTVTENITPTFMDYILYNLRGMKLYSPNLGEEYVLPAVWMFNQIMIALVIGYYPVKDLCGYGKNTLLRTKSRTFWLTSKVIWVVLMVVLYYVILYIATFIFCIITDSKISLVPSEYITNLFYDIDLKNIYVSNFIFCIIVMPILTSITASVMQMVLSFVVNPFISFLSLVGFMLLSTYYSVPILIGNASMIIRSKFIYPDGFTMETSLLYLALYLIVSLTTGFIYFRRKDILNKS